MSVHAYALIVLFVNHLLQKVQRLALGALYVHQSHGASDEAGSLRVNASNRSHIVLKVLIQRRRSTLTLVFGVIKTGHRGECSQRLLPSCRLARGQQNFSRTHGSNCIKQQILRRQLLKY